MSHSFIFLITHELCIYVIHFIMKISILYPIMIFEENFFDHKSSTIFLIKPLEIWLNTPTWTHNLREI